LRSFTHARGVDVAVGLLRRGDLCDHPVHVGVELRIGLHVEDVGGPFDHLVEIGIVEGIGRRLHVVRLAAQRLRRALEVVHASRLFTLLEGRGDRDLAVGLDPRRPEDVVQPHRGERHRLEGILARRPLGADVTREGARHDDEGERGGGDDQAQQSHGQIL
jgi:hypothetical protein